MQQKKRLFLYLCVLLVFALLIRLVGLNQSLWQDEATTAKVVMSMNYYEILQKFTPGDFHPPLYYLFMKYWTNWFGYSEIALRMPSVLSSLIAGVFIYILGGIWSAILFLFNPLLLYYSQEARMYMLNNLWLVIAFYYFQQSLKSTGKKLILNSLFTGLFLGLSLLTFYGSVFFCLALFLFLLYKRKMNVCLLIGLSAAAIFAVNAKPFWTQIQNSQTSLSLVSNWYLVLGTASFKNLGLLPIKLLFGRTTFYPKSVYYLLTVSLSLLVGFWIFWDGLRKRPEYFFYLVLPILFGFITSFFKPLFNYFRFQYLLIPIVILLGSKTIGYWQKISLSAIFLACSLFTVLTAQNYRDDWRQLVREVPKSQAIYAIPASLDAFFYYQEGSLKTVYDLRDFSLLRKENQASLSITPQLPSLPKRFTVIPYTSDIYGLDYRRFLTEFGYSEVNKKTVRGLVYEEWQKESTK